MPQIEPIARGLIIADSKILLCHPVDPDTPDPPYYYLPGGHIEHNESAPEALARELMEEAGLCAQIGPFLAAHEVRFTQRNKPKHEINLVFLVEQLDGARPNPTLPIESKEPDIAFAWADLAAVTDLPVLPRSTRAWLAAGCPETDRWISASE